MEEPLIDPSLLEGLTEEERQEALAAAAAAKRAEERAEQRALERAIRAKEEAKEAERQREQERLATLEAKATASNKIGTLDGSKVAFVSKRARKKQMENVVDTIPPDSAAPTGTERGPGGLPRNHNASSIASDRNKKDFSQSRNVLTEKERRAVQDTYLGKSSTAQGELDAKSKGKSQKKAQTRVNKKINFRFEWDETDDTLDDSDPLYSGVVRSHSSGGPNHSGANGKKRRRKNDILDDDDDVNNNTRYGSARVSSLSINRKPIERMTTRDWRIFRENHEIVVRGGRAPPPLRSFREQSSPDLPSLNPKLLDAIENVLRYREPTPIQRQAIPIGLQRRDLIGIAETGSGKTCAFGVPLLHYLMQLPPALLNRVADDGPMAIVLAPTRELALQIHGEFEKLLSRQNILRTCAVVGGQPIQQQAQQLREGVHIVVGTPGRMNDCIDMAYLVLNQCCYIVLDEADRMIDMGFAPQMESILEAMGGMLKSEDETEAYKQEEEDLKNLVDSKTLPRHRVTAMFSATMPMEVEQIAKRYLRHPAIISIGDRDSGKNSRIVQRVIFLNSTGQKESALRDLLTNPRYAPRRGQDDKIIIFVNEKKHADGVGRMVERIGRNCVVLHGGKSQDQREENLAAFRKGGVVLVATDVAGRGLDIPDVSHVINYDLPTRSIDSYSHRIGRTGRAGKEGLATSFLTDEDEGIMAQLKAYLEATGSAVPDRLARHPSASANRDMANVIH